MIRWLLNTFSAVELGLIIVGGAIVISVALFLVVRRFIPAEARLENNEVAGVLLGLLGALYGIVLGFVIIVLFEDFRAANDTVHQESTALAQLYRSTDLYPPRARLQVGKDIANYAYAVRTSEWQLLRDGKESLAAHELLGALYRDVESVEPRTESQKDLQLKAYDSLHDIVSTRRERLTAANETIPGVFQTLLVGGGALLILFLYFFGMRNLRAHLMMIVGVAGLLAFSLLLAMMLAYPFSGQVAVSSDPFELGIIGQLDRNTGKVTQRICRGCVNDLAPRG